MGRRDKIHLIREAEEIMYKISLVKPHLPILEEIEPELREMLGSGRLTNFGPFSQILEHKIRELVGVKYALCISNATTGLMLLLNTLRRGSEVLVPSFTFLPTVQAILWNSLKPVFVDIDESTYTVSPSAVASKITGKTSAILAVHTFGNPCTIEELEEIAKRNNIRLFFDSAHAFGSRHGGKYLGSFGDAEVFSLSATKTLPCGEGGVITTNSDFVYQAILDRRNYGFKNNSRDCDNMGCNGKITEFSAILGIKEIDSIDAQVQARNLIANRYRRDLQKFSEIEFQQVKSTDVSAYKDFTITIEGSASRLDRIILKEELGLRGIETQSYFSPAIHQMRYFKRRHINKEGLTNTEALERKILSLPIYSDLRDNDIDYIIQSIYEVYELYFTRRNRNKATSNTNRLLTDNQSLHRIAETVGSR